MRFELENAQVNADAIDAIVTQGKPGAAAGAAQLDPPKPNPFTMDEAKAACDNLVAKVASANDFSNILKAVAQVAKVFI